MQITTIMEVIPIIIPSRVRNDRSLLARNESSATPVYSMKPACPFSSCLLSTLFEVSIGGTVLVAIPEFSYNPPTNHGQ